MKIRVCKEIRSAPTIAEVNVRHIPMIGYQVEITFEPCPRHMPHKIVYTQQVVDEMILLRFELYAQLGQYNNTKIDLIPEESQEHQFVTYGKIVMLDEAKMRSGSLKGEYKSKEMYVFLILDPEQMNEPAPSIAKWTPDQSS